MRVAALVSGGKDSTLALWTAQNHGWDVTHLVTVKPKAQDSWMFHVPNTDLAPLMAEAVGAQLVEVETEGAKELELDDLERALAPLDIEGFVSGAVASEYQRTRLERIGHRLRLKTFTPLWHKRVDEILATVAREGWDVRFAAVAAEGLTERWLGRRMDAAALAELDALRLRYGVHPGGEGGEYETATLDAPCYHRRIEVVRAEVQWHRDGGSWRILEARLAAKPQAPAPGPAA